MRRDLTLAEWIALLLEAQRRRRKRRKRKAEAEAQEAGQ